MVEAFLWGLFGAAFLLVGAWWAYRFNPSRVLIAVVMAIGSGVLFGAVTASLPIFASLLVKHALLRLHFVPTAYLVASLTLLLTVFAASYVFGFYLALLTRRGIEHTQAFTALDHPGYKHFLRLRVRADGKGVDGFCIGLTDPLAEGAKPELVDTFTWRPGG